MNVKIIVHSKTGNTLSVAEKLRGRLETAGHTVRLEQVRAANESEIKPESIKLSNNPKTTDFDLLVFGLGVALAALGGIGAAPFLPVQPMMGDQYQMQGFITVVIGGMGSYVGAFVGAMILGMARAFGDYFALKLQLSPTIAEASTVIIMIVVLLLRPQGLFGKKD